MTDGFDNHGDMLNSLCDGFICCVNDTLPKESELLCNQDGYEVLTNAFGIKCQKKHIENATNVQIQQIAYELSEYLEEDMSAEDVRCFINCAIKQSFGDLQLS